MSVEKSYPSFNTLLDIMGAELSNTRLTAEEEAECKRKARESVERHIAKRPRTEIEKTHQHQETAYNEACSAEEGSEHENHSSTTDKLLPVSADEFDAFIDYLTYILPTGSRLRYRISPEQETKLSSTLTTALIMERFNDFQSHNAATATAAAPDIAISTYGTTPSYEASSDETSEIEEEGSLVPKGAKKSKEARTLQVQSDEELTGQELESRTSFTPERGTKRKSFSGGDLKDLDGVHPTRWRLIDKATHGHKAERRSTHGVHRRLPKAERIERKSTHGIHRRLPKAEGTNCSGNGAVYKGTIADCGSVEKAESSDSSS